MKDQQTSPADEANSHSRREFIRRASYAAPVLLSLDAVPSFAQQGSAAGDPGDGGMNPQPPVGNGPQPRSAFNCDNPMQPIDSDAAVSMCELTDASDGTLLFQDIIVPTESVPSSVNQGNVFGTCDNFICNAS